MGLSQAYGARPRPERLSRLARTPDELGAAIRDTRDAELAQRPDAKNWAANEVIGHLRDIEELVVGRVATILAMHEPTLREVDPDRWATERQYLRCDAREALAAFRARRRETLELLSTLSDEQWGRRGVHARHGPHTIDDFVAMIAAHDDSHLDQLVRALGGRV